MAKKFAYGWKKQKPDSRDKVFRPCMPAAGLPAAYDQRSLGVWPSPYDQGQLGSCTGNGIAGIVHFRLVLEGKEPSSNTSVDSAANTPSRLFIYRQERVIEGSLEQDSGAEVRDGLAALADKGVCFEDLYPYSDDTDTSNGKRPPFIANPPVAAWAAAWHHRISKYETVAQHLEVLQAAISSKNPVVFGFLVYQAFESDAVAKTGIVPMPKTTDAPIGGHCVVAIGYDNTKKWFICRNSWGESWGDKGYFYMPYDYILDPKQSSDFWVIDAVP
jgi:C1A family cysteine protease